MGSISSFISLTTLKMLVKILATFVWNEFIVNFLVYLFDISCLVHCGIGVCDLISSGLILFLPHSHSLSNSQFLFSPHQFTSPSLADLQLPPCGIQDSHCIIEVVTARVLSQLCRFSFWLWDDVWVLPIPWIGPASQKDWQHPCLMCSGPPMIVACSCCMGDSVLAREWPMGFLHSSLVGMIQSITATPLSMGNLSSFPSAIP